MKKNISLLVIFIFICCNVNGQTKNEIKHSKKMYEWTWVNKKDKRYIRFYFDTEVDYVTINDWTGSSDPSKSKTIDAYKAFIKGDKLILPAENDDHHCPYCEIEILNQKLIYQCNEANNFKDNIINKTHFGDKTIFERLRE